MKAISNFFSRKREEPQLRPVNLFMSKDNSNKRMLYDAGSASDENSPQGSYWSVKRQIETRIEMLGYSPNIISFDDGKKNYILAWSAAIVVCM